MKELQEILDTTHEDIIAYRKHLSYQIKQIKDKLDKIPVRLEEQNKALPERIDWEKVTADKEVLQKNLAELESDLRKLQSGNGADVKRKELQDKISEISKKLSPILNKAEEIHLTSCKKKQEEISSASLRFNEALNNQKLMQQTIEADERMIERVKENDFEAQLQALRDQWPSSKFEVSPDINVCPMCGRTLPADCVQEKIDEMRKNFNLQREAKIKQLNESAAKVKKAQEDAAEELKRLEQKLEDDKKSLEDIKQSINTIFAEKQQLEKVVVKSIEEIVSEDAEYSSLDAQQNELKKQLDLIEDCEDDNEKVAELKERISNIKENIEQLSNTLAQKTSYDHITSLIEGINKEKKDLISQLSELEKKEDVARRYQERQNTILESIINKHFSVVKWKLFRTVNNGGDPFDEPYCECYVNDVAYHDGLNQAARLNAGLDICNALCNYYEVSAPIIIDNSESSLNILATKGQQVRLEVSDCDLHII